MKYSPNIKATILLLAVTTLYAPLTTYAVNGTNANEDSKQSAITASRTAACLAISEKIGTKQNEKLKLELTERERIREETRTRREKKLDEDTQKIEAKNKVQNQKMTELYTKLAKLAETNTQNSAVAKFKLDSKAAITTYQNAITQAQNTFREDLNALAESNKSKIESGLSSYNNAIEVARQTALTACNNGVATQTLQNNYNNDRQTAEATFKQLKQQTETTESQIDAIVQKRKTAIALANNNFKSSMEQIRAEFQTNFAK